MADSEKCVEPLAPVDSPVIEKKIHEEPATENCGKDETTSLILEEKSAEVESVETTLETAAEIGEQIEELHLQSSQSDTEMVSGNEEPLAAAPLSEFQPPRTPPARKALNPFAVIAAKTSSLGMLSQYTGDDDSDSSSDDSVVEIKQEYREIEIEDDINDDSCSDDDAMSVQSTQSTRERRKKRGNDEFSLSDLPPIEELQISVAEQECVELGKIMSIVDQLVLVESFSGTPPYDTDTVLFLDKGKRPLGKVFDIFGQVANPLYSVRFNSNAEIKEKQIEIGAKVYVAPKTEHTSFVILSEIMKFKGTDASWKGDFEAPEECLDFSDDEAEREHSQRRRQQDRQNYHPSTEDGQEESDENKKVRQENAGRGGRNRGSRGGRFNPGSGYGRNPPNQTNPHHSWHSNFQRMPYPSQNQNSNRPRGNSQQYQQQRHNPYQQQNDSQYQQQNNSQYQQNNYNYQQQPQYQNPGMSSYQQPGSSYINPYAMQQQPINPQSINDLLSRPPPPPPPSSNQ